MWGVAAKGMAWLRTHDPGLSALRRAGRAAILMPAVFALSIKAIENPVIATFAAFGSFAMLLLVDFTGPMRDRLLAQASLGLTGAVFVCLGTLASRTTWLAAVAMGVVGFGVIFAGVISSVIASATIALLLGFILPVTQPGPISSLPNRLEGWGLATGVSLLAISLLWPAPTRDPLRRAAAAACRALAERLQADVAFLLGEGVSEQGRAEAATRANAASDALARLFYATPYRPTGLSTSARAVVRLVDEIAWLNGIFAQAPLAPTPVAVRRHACAVKSGSALVLARSAELLEAPDRDVEPLQSALTELRGLLLELERTTTLDLPSTSSALPADEVVSALDPSFRAQELTFAVSQIAANVELVTLAEQRSWLDRLLGRQPAGLSRTFAAVQERAVGHFDVHSVWLHNSLRGAVALAVAVAVADETGVQHSFWVVLGTLSVLRSNALATGQNTILGLRGTIIGFVIGGVLLWAIGANTTLLWFLLPLAILIAGIAPAAISFAAGQAAFTLTILILFNIIQPLGWRLGLVRVEDVAIGCAVSLGVGLLLWPRGATAALGQALTEAYAASAGYLAAAVAFGLSRCDEGIPSAPAPTTEVTEAAAAARRLDDAFRTYLAERGPKPVPLAGVAGLITGVAGLRLAADAVLDLWQRNDRAAEGARAAATGELVALADAVSGWYRNFAAGVGGQGRLPEPLSTGAIVNDRLVAAVRRDLTDGEGHASAVAVRIVWTGDHIDAARRLQRTLVEPARAIAAQMAGPFGSVRSWRRLVLLGRA